MSFSSLVNALKNLRGEPKSVSFYTVAQAPRIHLRVVMAILCSRRTMCAYTTVSIHRLIRRVRRINRAICPYIARTTHTSLLHLCCNGMHWRVLCACAVRRLPNTTLERNPHSIRTISPCRRSLVNGDDGPDALTPLDTGATRLGMMSSTSTPTALADRATLTVDGAIDKRSCCSSPVTSCADDDEQQTVDDSDDVDDVPSTPSEDTLTHTVGMFKHRLPT
jgi:hypothetical protein